jgi:acetyltransferase-like isoleucine patch superfamily enzyme
MDLENFIKTVIKSDNFASRVIKGLYKFLISNDLPAPKIIFRPFYEIITLFRYIIPLLKNKIYYSPLFRSKCKSVDRGLNIINNLPWIEGDVQIDIGKFVTLDSCTFLSNRNANNARIKVGDDSYLGYGSIISSLKLVSIGNKVLIGQNCFIADNNGHHTDPNKRKNNIPLTEDDAKPVYIENNVWIGINSVILPGVTIGEGAIIGANTVVKENVPKNSIMMGVPGILVKR